MLVALGAQSAFAEPATTCVKATKVLTPKKHYTGGWTNKSCTATSATHEGKYEKLADFSESEEAQLKALLKYLKVESSGIDGKPTVKLTGANLQVASGEKEAETNGLGNVVIGADEKPFNQSGSNNLAVGGEAQEFTSYGGILAGSNDVISAPFASVVGGSHNRASGEHASITAGTQNTASGPFASVGGGAGNTANFIGASVSGGTGNTASNEDSSVSGGADNVAAGRFASTSPVDGFGKAWVGGGYKNVANLALSSIFGGKELSPTSEFEAIP
jgi:hypothetical protein